MQKDPKRGGLQRPSRGSPGRSLGACNFAIYFKKNGRICAKKGRFLALLPQWISPLKGPLGGGTLTLQWDLYRAYGKMAEIRHFAICSAQILRNDRFGPQKCKHGVRDPPPVLEISEGLAGSPYNHPGPFLKVGHFRSRNPQNPGFRKNPKAQKLTGLLVAFGRNQ